MHRAPIALEVVGWKGKRCIGSEALWGTSEMWRILSRDSRKQFHCDVLSRQLPTQKLNPYEYSYGLICGVETGNSNNHAQSMLSCRRGHAQTAKLWETRLNCLPHRLASVSPVGTRRPSSRLTPESLKDSKLPFTEVCHPPRDDISS